MTHIKIREPRKLECKETMQSLQQWRMQFRQYMKQDDQYRLFLSSATQWNPTAQNYGFGDEETGLERTAAELMDDCKDFLHILATFLPHGYLTDKLVTTTTSFNKAFEIIQEHYGLLPTQESFLDLETFVKQTGESYRQFYERIIAHARTHLQQTQGVTVDEATVPQGGDRITVSHANVLALIWLRKIHPELINIVRTEYSMELRDNKPLSGLVPRIAVNVDNLLNKYDKVGGVNAIKQENYDALSQVNINRTFVRNNTKNREAKSPFCPGCYNISKNSEIRLHFKHQPSECPRKAVVKIIQMDDIEDALNDIEHDVTDGNNTTINSVNYLDVPQVTQSYAETSSGCFNVNAYPNIQNMDIILANIQSKINTFRKEESPTMCCKINELNILCLIDEGSVINCCSYSFVKRAGIPIESVVCSAIGANKSPMNVAGITKYDIVAAVIGTNTPSNILISKMIVIHDLGTDILLGQPAKIDNCMITVPHKSHVKFLCTEGKEHKVSYPVRYNDEIKLHEVMKVKEAVTIYPDQVYVYQLPNHFLTQNKVTVTERPSKDPWLDTQIVDVNNGCIQLKNINNHAIYLRKHQHIADITNVKQVNLANVNKVLTGDHDYEHLEPYEDWDYKEDFVADVKIDPDGTMEQEWQVKFLDLCKQFTDIINYRPSKYNGFYGDVDNSINFRSLPPPTEKIHICPNTVTE